MDDEMLMDDDGEEIKEDIDVEKGFKIRRVKGKKRSEMKKKRNIV
jgi:hypothetical protein